jgi:type I restriction enzyme, S subunit
MAASDGATTDAKIPNGWTPCTVQDIVGLEKNSCVGGPFGSNLTSKDYVDSPGVPVSRGNNLTLGKERYIDRDFMFVSERKAATLLQNTAFPGDLVFTQRGTIGQIGLIPRKARFSAYVLSQNQMKLRPNEAKADSVFLYYYFISPVAQGLIQQNSIGSTIPGFNLGQLRAFPLVLPPILEQRAIGDILSTLDDKIELNRRMNDTLEALARALFRSWFVDFDPVRAKAEGLDPGLPKPVADLFPDSFEDSELGETPKGWWVGTLGDFAALNPESWSKDTRPDTIHYVDLSNTKWGRIESVMTHSRQEAPSRAQRVLRPGDTIVGTVRPGNGSYAFVTEEKLTGSTGFAVLRPHRQEYREYVYLAATAAENIEELAHLADGAAYPAVRPDVVAATVSIQPPDFVLTSFAKTAGPLLARIAASDRESRTLAALRDSLLPKLLSGELSVKKSSHVGKQIH